MKRLICVAVTMVIMIGGVSAYEAPPVSAASAILMDAASGRVLYQKDADTPRLIASTTKLMTALVAVESGHALDEIVCVRPEWTGIEGSSIYLKPGERLTLETLLYGMLLRSGNDAAHAVAGYCGGDGFVAAMNAKAAALGMRNTHFENPSGLDGADHRSTARDMALLAKACLENQSLRAILSAKSAACEGRVFTNHNKLLWRYEGCIGLKTGYTKKAGRTLVSAAERNGMTLICVTLNAPNDWKDHTALLDHGFSNFEPRCLAGREEILCWLPVQQSLIPLIPIRAKEEIWIAVSRREQVKLVLKTEQPVHTAPLNADSPIGIGVVQVDGEEVFRIPLYTPYEIQNLRISEKAGILERILGR